MLNYPAAHRGRCPQLPRMDGRRGVGECGECGVLSIQRMFPPFDQIRAPNTTSSAGAQHCALLCDISLNPQREYSDETVQGGAVRCGAGGTSSHGFPCGLSADDDWKFSHVCLIS